MRLDEIISRASAAERTELELLKGKAAIANAKIAYAAFREVAGGERFRALAEKSARVQRPLWASTGTKNPQYSDVLYLDSLIGPDTVNTVPPQTYLAFLDHGRLARTIDADSDAASAALAALERHGIVLEEVTDRLTVEGVKSFSDSFDKLIATIEARRAKAVESGAAR